VANVIEQNTLDRLRPLSHNNHFWKGQPGFWRELLPAPLAHRISLAHAEYFTELGYRCDPDQTLTLRVARRHWRDAQSRGEEQWMASIHQTLSRIVQSLRKDPQTI
jgi:hypothetical protein